MSTIKFSEITETSQLISYLNNPVRFSNVKYFTRYMGLDTLKSMFSEEKMLINNPVKMNDLYEYKAFGNQKIWDKICFTSFITQTEESMAMWSMYAQPWSKGVMILVPANVLRDLVKDTHSLLTADYNNSTGRYSPGNIEISAGGILHLSRVVYVDEKEIRGVRYDDKNTHFANPYSIPELAGYIKDVAWEYEKESRIRVDLPSSYTCNAIYIRLPEEFLRNITIITGPRFAGSVLTSLPEKYRPSINIQASKFNEKLAWVYCDSCPYAQSN